MHGLIYAVTDTKDSCCCPSVLAHNCYLRLDRQELHDMGYMYATISDSLIHFSHCAKGWNSPIMCSVVFCYQCCLLRTTQLQLKSFC